ncbi:aminopeptidase N-like [Lytechinus variegatus]|uniref:aminopeptidase N-like n=1 Tax=Lytechinus variegatus TaxID=7654 RepID=UPI001BB166D3|nr:aminopeptidase N-like [Lytechinus variegatus]
MDMPGEGYKDGKIRISRNTAILIVCTYGSSLLLVGLLCGLLPADDPSCNIVVPEPSEPPSEPAVTTKPLMTTKDSVTTESAEPTHSPTSAPKPWESLRLPTSLIPSHYDIELQIDIDDQQRFEGTISIIMECRESTDLLLLHSKELEIVDDTGSMTAVADGSDVPLKGAPRLYPANQYLIVELDEMLTPGQNYTFTINFKAPLEDGLVGLYRSSYQASDGTPRYLATTFFAPTDARKAFPCFDEPAMKVTFNLTLIHQDGYLALGNMPILSTTPEMTGWTRSVFDKSVPMSTYLVCFVVCDFVAKNTTTGNDVLLSVWAREDASDSLDYALEKGAQVLDFFDGYFGTKFPLPKMDMIAIPDFAAGAMENWGLITYRESALLYTPGVSSASNKQRVCAIVAHELAHQWFGNLVTLEWWDDTWLNEGFASYVEYLGADAAEPDWGMTDQFVAADFQTALDADALITSRPIIVDVETPDDINQQFDTISYNKGASILRMLQNFLGEETFKKGLANYLKEFEYSNAKNTDLWRVLTQAAEEDGKEDIKVEDIMRTWTEQMNYPSINVTRDYTTGFTVSQDRFLINPGANATTDYDDLGYIWYVPFKYTTNDTRNYTEPMLEWIEPSMASVSVAFDDGTAADDWLLANVNGYGFYRVNYDTENWELISKQLTADHEVIPISSRAALISDAFSLAVSGQLSQVTAFNLTFYLEDEREYVPWSVLNRVMGYVDLMLSRSPAYGLFSTYMRQQVEPFYEYVGWNDSAGSHLDQRGRVIAISLACGYGNEDCVNTAINYYATWMNDSDSNPVPPNQKSRVYCTAISAGGQEEWDFAYREYLRTPVATEKNILLAGMGCSKKPWILKSYLDMSIAPNGTIKSQDAENVAGYVAYNPVGYDLAWDFFRVNWDFYRNEYGSSVFQFADLIESVTAHFNTEFQLQELLDFIETHPDQGTGSRAFAQAVDQTRANIRWMEDYEEEVMEWLEWAVSA